MNLLYLVFTYELVFHYVRRHEYDRTEKKGSEVKF